jgi:hypothetical protein
MPPEKDWRTPVDETGNEALQYSDIAIGYVSRNDRYRADYHRALGRVKRGIITADDATASLVRRWGISFHAAPASAFDPRLAVARPDLSPSSIVLAPSLDGSGATGRLDMAMLGAVRARMKIGDFLHLILADSDGDEHLWISGALDEPLAMMLPIGLDPLSRLASAERFCRRLLGMAAGPPTLRPSPFRRQHLLTLLRALDGHRAGASRRELAAVLIDRDVSDYSASTDGLPKRSSCATAATSVYCVADRGHFRLLGNVPSPHRGLFATIASCPPLPLFRGRSSSGGSSWPSPLPPQRHTISRRRTPRSISACRLGRWKSIAASAPARYSADSAAVSSMQSMTWKPGRRWAPADRRPIPATVWSTPPSACPPTACAVDRHAPRPLPCRQVQRGTNAA